MRSWQLHAATEWYVDDARPNAHADAGSRGDVPSLGILDPARAPGEAQAGAVAVTGIID